MKDTYPLTAPHLAMIKAGYDTTPYRSLYEEALSAPYRSLYEEALSARFPAKQAASG